MSPDEHPFTLPFVRWANIQTFVEQSTPYRQIYDHELIYVMDGRGQILIEATNYDARPDRLFLVQPRVWHSYRPSADSTMHLLGIHFDWTPLNDGLHFPSASPVREPVDEAKFREPREIAGWDVKNHPYLDLQDHLQVRQALEATVTACQRDNESQSLSGALLAVALLQIQRVARTLQQYQINAALGADALRRLHRARLLLESSPQKPLSIEEVALKIGWSGNHMRRVFHQAFGVSPVQHQIASRLQYAREMLRHEKMSIAQVGANCGFADAAHFARVFRAHTGMTPRQFLSLSKRFETLRGLEPKS